MYTTLQNVLFLVGAGAGTGVLGAVLGTGGGVFLIPVLLLCFGVPMHFAVATSIISVIATSSAVACTNVERGTANMRLGMTLEIATSLGAIAGAFTAGWLSATVLESLFAVVLLPTAVLMWRGVGERAADPHVQADANFHTAPAAPRSSRETKGILDGDYYDPSLQCNVTYHVRHIPAGLGISLVAGNLSGLLGIGGGVFKVPALHLACGVPIRGAAATSNFMIGVTATASAFWYLGRGEVRPAMTAAVVLGVLLGSAAGSYLNQFVHGKLLQRLFAVMLIAVAVEMLIRAITG